MDNKHILIVEDDPTWRLFLSAALERAGYAVRAAESGARAVTSFVCQTADLAVVDMMMPGLDGQETIRELRELRSDLKVLAISGEDTLDQGRLSGAQRSLSKPFSVGELLKTVGELLSA